MEWFIINMQMPKKYGDMERLLKDVMGADEFDKALKWRLQIAYQEALTDIYKEAP